MVAWGLEPPENCEREHLLVVKIIESQDNDAALTLVLNIYIFVLLVWIALFLLLHSLKYIKIYSLKYNI